MTRDVRTVDDVLALLDGLFDESVDRWTGRAGAWWDEFYADRTRQVPFFGAGPDETLVAWTADGRLPSLTGRRVLDVGCGAGRNAVWLAQQGALVDAVDLSPRAAELARVAASDAGVDVTVHVGDAFRLDLDASAYDLVHDSGCFHHLPPHRRVSYRGLVDRVLRPGGFLALTCFAAGAMGSTTPDADLYRLGRLEGGLAYTPEELTAIFAELDPVEARRMRELPPGPGLFGKDFLWAALFRRPGGRG